MHCIRNGHNSDIKVAVTVFFTSFIKGGCNNDGFMVFRRSFIWRICWRLRTLFGAVRSADRKETHLSLVVGLSTKKEKYSQSTRRYSMNLEGYISAFGIPEDEDPYLEEPETEQNFSPEEGDQP